MQDKAKFSKLVGKPDGEAYNVAIFFKKTGLYILNRLRK